MSIQSVTAEIISGRFTNEELSSLIDSIKYARARLGKAAIRALRIGDNVTFNSAKQGRVVTGFVTKIAIKYVTVHHNGSVESACQHAHSGRGRVDTR